MAFEHAGKGDRNEVHEAADDKHCGDLRRAESVPATDALNEAENHRMGDHQQTHACDAEPHVRGQPSQWQALVRDYMGDVRKGQQSGQCRSEHDARHRVEERVRADLAY
ncbi:hypothetical protein D3C78_1503660 [compost metagenome]